MGKFADIRKAIKNMKASKRQQIATETRLKYLDRWMARTREIGKPCEDASQIDYGD